MFSKFLQDIVLYNKAEAKAKELTTFASAFALALCMNSGRIALCYNANPAMTKNFSEVEISSAPNSLNRPRETSSFKDDFEDNPCLMEMP
jgi:thiazole synthase ThiGH ThiG subunit